MAVAKTPWYDCSRIAQKRRRHWWNGSARSTTSTWTTIRTTFRRRSRRPPVATGSATWTPTSTWTTSSVRRLWFWLCTGCDRVLCCRRRQRRGGRRGRHEARPAAHQEEHRKVQHEGRDGAAPRLHQTRSGRRPAPPPAGASSSFVRGTNRLPPFQSRSLFCPSRNTKSTCATTAAGRRCTRPATTAAWPSSTCCWNTAPGSTTAAANSARA